MWTWTQLRQWRWLFKRNACEGFDRTPTAAEREKADQLRSLGWSPHRAAAQVYTMTEEKKP